MSMGDRTCGVWPRGPFRGVAMEAMPPAAIDGECTLESGEDPWVRGMATHRGRRCDACNGVAPHSALDNHHHLAFHATATTAKTSKIRSAISALAEPTLPLLESALLTLAQD